MSSQSLGEQARETKLQYLQALEEKEKLARCLPHLHGWKWYTWAREFFESTNRYNFLVAANQISKSSSQIRKCIDWATDIRKWPKLWPTRPKQFWYCYPDLNVASIEFSEKWVKEFLPRDEYKDHEIYGWKDEWKHKRIYALHFNSGVSVYFKSYEMDPQSLQTASVYAMFCDEELPEHLFSELNARISAPTVSGYFHMVFTATLGQEFWRETVEVRGNQERFKGAFKRQVSMFDCLHYEDGSLALWTPEKIQEIIDSCKSEAEVQRRVYGRFVLDTGLKYEGFSAERNVLELHRVPKDWLVYSGVDIGSGGSGHPAAITFVAVSPDFSKGRVFKGWRGDGVITSSSDILAKYRELRGSMKPVAQFYDWASSEFRVVSDRVGDSFQPADKDRDSGERLLNVLFKSGMLKIYLTPETQKLINELRSIKHGESKTKSRDDFVDSLRYAVTKIPWDFSKLAEFSARERKKIFEKTNEAKREAFYRGDDRQQVDGIDLIEAEFDEANETMDYYQEDDPSLW